LEDYDEQKKIKILFVLPSRSSFIQKDLELLRKHFDVRVRGFSFEHEKIKPSIPRDGRRVSTKLSVITLRAREDPKCKFTSLAHLLTADFLKQCFWELKRDKAPGIDGVMWGEYEP